MSKCAGCKDYIAKTSHWGKCGKTGVKRDTKDNCMVGKKLLKLKIVYTGKTMDDVDRKSVVVEGYGKKELEKNVESVLANGFALLISSEWVKGFEEEK